MNKKLKDEILFVNEEMTKLEIEMNQAKDSIQNLFQKLIKEIDLNSNYKK